MADALDLGSSAARRGGSSPPSRTIIETNAESAIPGLAKLELDKSNRFGCGQYSEYIRYN